VFGLIYSSILLIIIIIIIITIITLKDLDLITLSLFLSLNSSIHIIH